MSQNAVAEIRKLLGVDNEKKPQIMIVADRSDAVTIVIDHAGNKINIETSTQHKEGDRVIVSGNKILGKAEQPTITIWVN